MTDAPGPLDFNAPRLFVDADIVADTRIPLSREQANYLLNVLRLGPGDAILIFNGRDGEWRAEVAPTSRRDAELVPSALVRTQEMGPDIDYLFAPLKRSRLDYMVQKATEMGARRLRPVMTERTVAERVNLDRMRANVVEAAEQCGILTIPEVLPPLSLAQTLAGWDETRRLIFCDEAAQIADPLAALATLAPGPLAVLIGPEGGFSKDERTILKAKSFVLPIALGPRIMRADTAAVAALALVNAVLGDWRQSSNSRG